MAYPNFEFEFKIDGEAREALAQIKRGAYLERYRHQGKPLHLVGVNFDSQLRQITSWQMEQNAP